MGVVILWIPEKDSSLWDELDGVFFVGIDGGLEA